MRLGRSGALFVGTSGYLYPHWRGILYPPGLAVSKWLPRYAEVFATVELNTTFYRLPSVEAVDRWRQTTPPGFLFACKGSRFLTHLKRLREVDTGVTRYFEPVRRLRRKLGPVLWQLPPQMNKADPQRLDAFLGALPRKLRQVVEFRSDAWYVDEICDVLDKHRVAFCEHDLLAAHPPRFTGGFRYLRFHGATGKYQGRYGRSGLRAIAKELEDWRAGGHDAFAYFNNDTRGYAVFDALELLDLLGQPRASADLQLAHPA